MPPEGEAPSAATAAGLSPPVPCDAPSAYTVARVQRGLKYAEALLTTWKVSPLTSKLLELYSAACEQTIDTLQAKDAGENISQADVQGALREVYDHEQSIRRNNFLKEIVSSENRKILVVEPLVGLRKYVLYSRYGDYLKHLVTELRSRAREYGLDKEKKLSARYRWTMISKAVTEDLGMIGPLASRLDIETIPAPRRRLTEEQLKGNPTLRAIHNTSEVLGLDWENTVRAVQAYGKRNDAFHSNIDDLLASGQLGSVAEMMYRDLHDLPKLFDSKDADDEFMFEIVIKRLINEWFVVPEGSERFWNNWAFTPELARLSNDMRATIGIKDESLKKRKEEVRRQNEEKIKKNLMKEAVRMYADEELLRCLVEPPEAGSLPDPKLIGAMPLEKGKSAKRAAQKRRASDAISEKQVRNLRTKRSREFTAIVTGWEDAHHQLADEAEKWIRTAKDLRVRQRQYHIKWGLSTEPPPTDLPDDPPSADPASQRRPSTASTRPMPVRGNPSYLSPTRASSARTERITLPFRSGPSVGTASGIRSESSC